MQNMYWMIDRLEEILGIHRSNYDDKNGKVQNWNYPKIANSLSMYISLLEDIKGYWALLWKHLQRVWCQKFKIPLIEFKDVSIWQIANINSATDRKFQTGNLLYPVPVPESIKFHWPSYPQKSMKHWIRQQIYDYTYGYLYDDSDHSFHFCRQMYIEPQKEMAIKCVYKLIKKKYLFIFTNLF